jgi:hypothetical protein
MNHNSHTDTKQRDSLLSSRLTSSGGENDANNETIKGQCFSKDENEDHTNKKLWLLGISSAKYSPTLK